MDIQIRSEFESLVAVKYARKVVNGEIVAGKYIILECIRFLKDLSRVDDEDFEWYFDTKTYEFIISFSKLFKFADGINAGKPMTLAEFQEWILANLFCWKHKKEGYIRFSRAYIQVSRKQGKSFLLGLILLIKGLVTPYGQFSTVATKKDQAEIVIKEVKKLLDCSIEQVKEKYKIYGKAKISKIVCDVTQAEIFPLSSDANTLDGLGIDTCVVDEFGAHPNYELYEVMRSSQVYKPDSQICIITTAYPNVNTSPAYKERCMLVDMYEGKTPLDDRYFSAIYELDADDDYMDRSTWGKSNPLVIPY